MPNAGELRRFGFTCVLRCGRSGLAFGSLGNRVGRHHDRPDPGAAQEADLPTGEATCDPVVGVNDPGYGGVAREPQGGQPFGGVAGRGTEDDDGRRNLRGQPADGREEDEAAEYHEELLRGRVKPW
jgi:hypothetical protein